MCVCVLILNAILKLAKGSLVDKWTYIIFAVVFALALFFDISAAILVLVAGLAGYLIKKFAVKEDK